MLFEIDLLGAFVPGTALWLALALVGFAPLDALLRRLGLYRLFWHEPLARFALFVCLFCGSGLVASMQ